MSSMLEEKYTPPYRDDGPTSVGKVSVAPTPVLSSQAISNYKSRVTTDLATLFGTSGQAIYDGCEIPAHLRDPTIINNDLQEAAIIGSGTGFAIGWLIHLFSMRFGWYAKYANDKARNPFFRVIKTLMLIGLVLGGLIANLLPLPQTGKQFLSIVIANSVCLFFGLFVAAPYCFIRAKLKIDPVANGEKSNLVMGEASWSKFEKTFLVGGTSVGQIAGVIYSDCVKTPLTTSMLVGGEIFGLASTLIGIITIPLINKFFGKALKSDKNDPNAFRHNYARSGMAVGTAIGSTIGVFLGGPIGAALGGAIGNLLGGAIFAKYGKQISEYTQKKWNVDRTTQNPWDYACRSTSAYFAGIGSIIGFCLPIPFGMLAGGFIGGIIGSGLSFLIIGAAAAKRTGPTEEKAHTLAWNERLGNGGKKGMILGGLIGLVVALTGPVGMVAGIGLGAAIGSTFFGAFDVWKGRNKPAQTPPTPMPITATEEKFVEVKRSAAIPIPRPIEAKKNHEMSVDTSASFTMPTPRSSTATTLNHLVKRPVMKEECISNEEEDAKKVPSRPIANPKKHRSIFQAPRPVNFVPAKAMQPQVAKYKRH
jgi:hypothetical protein